MKHLLTIMAHAGATPMLDGMWQEWAKFGADILIFCPVDSLVPYRPGVTMLPFGKAEHHGPESIRRFRFLLKFLASGTDYEAFSIFEYDSICLAKNLMKYAPSTGIGCNRFGDNRPNRGFEGTQFFHPPLLMMRNGLECVNKACDALHDTDEQGFWDRWLGYACERAGIPVTNFLSLGTGFSRNTIEPDDAGAAIEAVDDGAVLIHGIKRMDVYTTLKNEHRALIYQ